jgi:hypothetical protein
MFLLLDVELDDIPQPHAQRSSWPVADPVELIPAQVSGPEHATQAAPSRHIYPPRTREPIAVQIVIH